LAIKDKKKTVKKENKEQAIGQYKKGNWRICREGKVNFRIPDGAHTHSGSIQFD
jgi:hypothetical protein